jgi:hypothetical protein
MSNFSSSKGKMTFSNYWRFFRELTLNIKGGAEICPVETDLQGDPESKKFTEKGKVSGAIALSLVTPL